MAGRGAGRGEWGQQGRALVGSPRQQVALRGGAPAAARPTASSAARAGAAGAAQPARPVQGTIPWNGGSPRQRASAPAASSPSTRASAAMSARPAATTAPASPPRQAAATARPASPGNGRPQAGSLDDPRASLARTSSWRGEHEPGRDLGSPSMSRVSSSSVCGKDGRPGAGDGPIENGDLFHIIQQLAAAENAQWNILDGLKSNSSHASFFCREYWGSSCSRAQLSLERLNFNERKQRQVQQACILESLSLGVAAHLCSGTMQNVSVTIRSRLRNLIYYVHENCLVLLDMVCQRWMLDSQNRQQDEISAVGHCPENLNLDILIRVKRYRRFRREEHAMALRQHNELILNVVRQLCRGATAPPKRPSGGPGTRSPQGGARGGPAMNPLMAVNEVLQSRLPLDRLRSRSVRAKMLQCMTFRPLLGTDPSDPDCLWPTEDPYERYGAEDFAADGPVIWFEPLPPMLPNLEQLPKLPPQQAPGQYTLVLDLDETLLHYFERDGVGSYNTRPGMHEFLERMNRLGFELVIFTAATQDYADWVIDQVDPTGLVHYRLYRQHALPWGPVFVKDLACLGRDLDRTLIIDNVQENFMLQPDNGVFIMTWYDDPHDTALTALSPLLEELLATGAKVPELLDKYREQVPVWAGFDQVSQLDTDFTEMEASDLIAADDGFPDDVEGALESGGALEGEPAEEDAGVYMRADSQEQGQQDAPTSSPPPTTPTPPVGGGGGPAPSRQAHHAPFSPGCGPLQAPPPARSHHQAQRPPQQQQRQQQQLEQQRHAVAAESQQAPDVSAHEASPKPAAAGLGRPAASTTYAANRYQSAATSAGTLTPQAAQPSQQRHPQAPQAYLPPARTQGPRYPQLHAHQATKVPVARQLHLPQQLAPHQMQPAGGQPRAQPPAQLLGVAGPYQQVPSQAYHQPTHAGLPAQYGQRQVGVTRALAPRR